MPTSSDLKQEQAITLSRPRRECGCFARMLFWGMDLAHGKELTLPKVKLLEILARIPYQSWEIRQYGRMHSDYANEARVAEARRVIEWGRAAQDNEFWHLRVINERMQQLGIKESLLQRLITPLAVIKYTIFSRILAFVSIKSAFLLNADFEDHAEHEYMQYVMDHPELENEAVKSAVAKENGDFASWADVFRQIGLDERDHMNNSLAALQRWEESS